LHCPAAPQFRTLVSRCLGFVAMNASFALLFARAAFIACVLILTSCGREPPKPPEKGPVDVIALTVERADVPVTAIYVAQTQSIQAVNVFVDRFELVIDRFGNERSFVKQTLQQVGNYVLIAVALAETGRICERSVGKPR